MPRPRRLDPQRHDFEALLGLIRQAFAPMEGLIDPPSSANGLTAGQLSAKARDEIALVIGPDRAPVACLFCKPEPPDTLYLGKLAVAPPMQGKGLGRALLTAAEAQARSLGLMRLRLEVRIELTGNQEIFSAWGFRKIAEKRHPGFDRTTSIEMEKLLQDLAPHHPG